MSTARHLILFTTNYPFSYTGGETMFVQPEIPHLAQEFETKGITVVPLHTSGEKFDTPPNIKVDRTLAENWGKWKIFHYLSVFSWPGFFQEIWRGTQHGGLVGIARIWRWTAIARCTWLWLQNFSKNNDDNLLIYTYWRGGQTLGAVRHSENIDRNAVVSRVHGYDLYEYAFSPEFQPWINMYPYLDKVITISEHGLSYLRKKEIHESKLLLSRLGVQPQINSTKPSTDGCIRLVSCSSISENKRLPFTAIAIKKFALKFPKTCINWTHFGDGPDRKKLENELIDIPSNLNIILQGQVKNKDVLNYYKLHPVDLFLLLSNSEGLPVSIQEALSMGIPVLATDVGGVSEAVSDGVNGSLVKSQDSTDSVANQISELLMETTELNKTKRRQEAIKQWSMRFNSEKNHRTLAKKLHNDLG